MKKKWAVWKTILVMLSSVFVVTGVTVGAIFLRNGGSGDVYPDDLYFVTEGQTLFRNGQFELTENDIAQFNLTVETNTEGVTNKKIELRFPSGTNYEVVGDRITDHIITVPHYVNIGEPFKITSLYKGDVDINEAGDTKECVLGGISRLIARSEHKTDKGFTYTTATTTIAVDTPVENIKIEFFTDPGSDKTITQIEKGETFYARAKFYPQNSEKLYNGIELKNVYFGTDNTESVEFEYDAELAKQQQGKFMALTQSSTNGIVAYAFRSADQQLRTVDQLKQNFNNDEDLYRAVFGNLTQPGSGVESEVNVEVTLATVTGFVARDVKLNDMHIDQAYTLRLQNSDTCDDYIGATVYGANSEPLDDMLSNVAIAFFDGDGQVTPIADEGKLKVTDASGNVLPYVEREEMAAEENKTVRYYLPCANVNPQYMGAGYWQLYTNDDSLDLLTLKVVLLKTFDITTHECEFYDVASYNPTITIDKTRSPEADVDWQDSSEMDFVLPYKEGSTELDDIKLTISTDDLKNVPANRTVMFFADFGNNDQNTTDALAKQIISENCLDLEHAGTYNVGETTHRLYPLILQGQNGDDGIIIKGSGSFTLYFATVKTNGQGFEFGDDKLYQILDFSKGRNVVINEMLNENSIESGKIDVTSGAQDAESGTLYIYPGQDITLTATIQIRQESWKVFKQQYTNLTFSVYSNGLDITNFFNIADPTLSDDSRHEVTYTFTVKPLLEFGNAANNLTSAGLAITSFKFYDTQAKWEKTISAQGGSRFNTISVYKPEITNIEFADDQQVSGTEVIFTLFNDQSEISSELRAKIKSTYAEDGGDAQLHDHLSEGEFIDALKQFVKITDIHGNDEYFDSEWRFETDSTDVIEVAGQTFTFKYVNNVKNKTARLYIVCGEKSTKDSHYITLKFSEVEGTIVRAEVDNKTFDNPTRVSFSVSGTAETEIDLKSKIKLYSKDDNGVEQEFTSYKIRFDGAGLTRIGASKAGNLFGTDGMLTVDGLDNYANISSLTALADVNTLTINKNFAQGEVLNFVIYDDTGVVNIALDVTIERCFELGNIPSEQLEVYAGINNAINVTLTSGNLADQILGYDKATKYVHLESNIYVLTGENNGAVGEVLDDNGTLSINFYDFWDKEASNFNVSFGDRDNYYALSFNIRYRVLRNIEIVPNSAKLAYSLTGEGDNNIWSYFIIQRKSGQNSDALLKQENIIVETNVGGFFAVAENGELTANSSNTVFGYGVDSILQAFSFYYKNGESKYLLQSADLKIETGVTLQEIAGALTYGDQSADIITLDGQKYLYLQSDLSWNFNYAKGEGYKLAPVNSIADSYSQTSLYTVSNSNGGYGVFINKINSAMRGRGDQNVFLIIKFEKTGNSGTTTAYTFVPLIVTRLGNKLVNYTKENATDTTKSTLDNAFESFEYLKENGIYQEVQAGQAYDIIQSIEFGGQINAQTLGFIYHQDLTPQIRLYRINGFGKFEKVYGLYNNNQITLNHLNQGASDVYLGLQIFLSSTTFENFSYNFLLKVTPDVEVESAKYAYNGSAEYVTGDNITINLDDVFGDDGTLTLNDGAKRFNVSGADAKDLPYTYEIVSMTDSQGTHNPTSAQNGEFVFGKLRAKFEVDDNNKTKLTLTPTKADDKLSLTFRRVYATIVGADGQLMSTEYTIKINSNTNYSIRYGAGVTSNGNNNGSIDVDHTYKNSGKDIEVKLQNGDTVDTGLHIVDRTKLTTEQQNAIASLEYSNNKLKVVRADYVPQNIEVPVTFYTEQGYLGTLTLHVKASGNVVFGSNELTAGSNVTFESLSPTVTLDGQTKESSNYTVDKVEAKLSNETLGPVFKEFDKNSKTLKLNSLIQDTKLTLVFTMHFGENVFIFEHTFTVKANITTKDGKAITPNNEFFPVVVTGADVVAGKNVENFENSLLFNISGDNKDNLRYTLKLQAGSGDDIKLNNGSDIDTNTFINGYTTSALPTINTLNVPQKTTVEISVKVELLGSDENAYQTFYIKYTFNLYPNKNIDINYPDLGNGGLTSEHIEDGATYESVENFISSTATFANGNRFVIKEITGVQNGTPQLGNDISGNSYTLAVVEGTMQNITIETNGTKFSPVNTTSGQITGRFTFHLGVEQNGNGDYRDLGTDSHVTLRLTCNEVFKDFTIILSHSVYSLQQNTTSADSTGDTELLFVDYYSANDNILANDRLLKMTFKNSINDLDYRILWKDAEGKEQSTAFPITKSYQGRTITFDLGGSASEYIGVFRANAFTQNADGTWKLQDEFRNNGKYRDIADGDLFADGIKPQLLSRIQMLYAGQPVDYTKISGKLKFSSQVDGQVATNNKTLESYTIEPTDIDKLCTLNGFNFDLSNGQQTSTKTFVTTYKYKLDIDVTADGIDKIESQEIAVGQEITSILKDRKIRHKSNDKEIPASDFVNENLTADLAILDKNSNSDENWDELERKYPGISNPYAKEVKDGQADKNLAYLIVSNRQEEVSGDDKKGTDFRLLGQGAKNEGNFVLVRFTYKVKTSNNQNGFTKHFDFVYKVVPDYQILYSGDSSNEGDEGLDGALVPSNRDHAAVAVADEQTSEYTIRIASKDGKDASGQADIVTIKHAGKDNNVAATSFTYTLTVDDETGYNIKENVTNKLKGTTTGFNGTSTGWTYTSSSKTTYTWPKAEETQATLEFSNISKVVFGEQKYKLLAEDDYGYRFLVYFTLKSSTQMPSISQTLNISEGEKFDIGAEYESLSLIETNGSLNITSTSVSPKVPDGVTAKLVTINNVEAWGFTEDPSGKLSQSGNHYTTNGKKLSQDADKKYLNRPQLFDIFVSKIEFINDKGETEQVYSASSASSNGIVNSLATADKTNVGQGNLYFANDTNKYRSPTANYTMTSLPSEWYTSSSTLEVTMAIELTYQAGGDKETLTITTKAIVTRNYTIETTADLSIRDGEKVTLTNILKPKKAGQDLSGGESVKYYDDTLKVTLPANKHGITLKLSATRGDKSLVNDVQLPIDNNHNYPRTQYLSLSDKLGATLTNGDKVNVEVVSGGSEQIADGINGYYIQYGSNGQAIASGNKTLEFTITAITEDTISLEHPGRIEQGHADITKFYLAVFNGTQTNPATYRVSQSYKVYAYYYGFASGYDGEVKTLTATGQNGENDIDLSTWAAGMTVKYRDFGVSSSTEQTKSLAALNGDLAKLHFAINTDEQSSGAATIDQSTGKITTTQDFKVSEYISISIYLRVGGLKGDFNADTENLSSMISLGTVRIRFNQNGSN